MKRTARFLGAVVGLAAIISSSQVAAAPASAKSSNVCVSASPPPGVTIHSIYQNGNSWSMKYTYQDRYGARSTRTKDGISPSLQAFHVGGGYSIRLRWSPCSVVHKPQPVLTKGGMQAIGIILGATSGNYVATSGSQLSRFNDTMQGNAATAAPNSDLFESGYSDGYRLWEAKLYPGSRATLIDILAKFPNHKRASYARNLLGRAWLDDKMPATAVKVFYDNYKADPRGDRAPDSLFFLGSALTDLGKTAEACKAFGELESAYPDAVTSRLAERIALGKTRAKCK
jgi:hypothetical protein